MKNSTI